MTVNLLGIHLTLLIGPAVPLPAPPALAEAIQSVEVTQADSGPSGFQITFQVGRGNPASLLDYPLLQDPLLRPFSRVILIVIVNATPRLLIDGIITHQQLMPSSDPGASTLAVTGEDVSVMMDLDSRALQYPGMSDAMIAAAIIARYGQYGLIPLIIPPLDDPPRLPIKLVPTQH